MTFPNVDEFLDKNRGRPFQEIEMEFFADFDAKFIDQRRPLSKKEAAEAEKQLNALIKDLK